MSFQTHKKSVQFRNTNEDVFNQICLSTESQSVYGDD